MERTSRYPITDRKEKVGIPILIVNNISISKGTLQILDSVNFSLSSGEHAVIVGPNGVGKTTLINIIAGLEEQDKGSVVISPNTNLIYVPQSIDQALQNLKNITILEYFKEAKGLKEIEEEMQKIEQGFLDPNKQHKSELDRYGDLQTVFQSLGGYTIEIESKAILEGMGFSSRISLNTDVSKLSGGEKTKLALAQALISNAELLLLDEPSNHLDSKSKEWFAKKLKSYKGATLVISHDQNFLQTFTQKVIELSPNESGIEVYNGSYFDYLKQKQNKDKTDKRKLEKGQKKIAKLTEVSNRLRAGRNAKISTDRQKKLEKVKLELPDKKQQTKRAQMVFEIQNESGFNVLQTRNLVKAYENKTITYPNIEIHRGEKVVIVGEVGTGKSTLLKIIAGLLKQDSGNIKLGHNVDIGYYSQEIEDLDADNTVIEEISNIAGKESIQKVRNLLGAFLFQGDDVYKKVGVLSFGERSRLMLAKLAVNKHNFLVLDEPTNHLDATHRSVVAKMIKNFKGSVIVVSHDQEFIKSINFYQVVTLNSI